MRIDLLLVRPDSTFFLRLARAFDRIVAVLDPAISVHRAFLLETDPAAIARRIAEPPHRRSGLILAVPDTAPVQEALGRVAREGLPVVQVVSRAVTQGAAYVGIDNKAAGRTAALFLARMQPRPGPVVAFCHSGLYAVHRDRISGFSDALARHAPHLAFECVLFHGDDGSRARVLLREALQTWPDLAGFYNAGGANGALAEELARLPNGDKVFFAGHELTDRSARALRDGVMDIVLDQEPEAQAQRAMDLMLHSLGFLQEPVENPAIRFVTLTAANV
ncbi:substrate-binding domain-containing protein [Rubellimicrobium aerolatum]|uniref:Substrate-binding domain-containing protein n=1 Tax=Rubellimicrobium aerolatum TaxID=490979 RepID=A0ABW0SI54_9RHOB|nr:LacI family transcriptional regulator [Rubellimicrobium aerolatum]